MKILLLTVGAALIVTGCIMVTKNICIGVLPLGAGLYAMAEGLFKK